MKTSPVFEVRTIKNLRDMIEQSSKLFANKDAFRVKTKRYGVAHFRSSSEKECIEQIKKLISYLPDNNLSDVRLFQLRMT